MDAFLVGRAAARLHHGRAVVASFGRQNLFVSSIERQRKKTSRTMMSVLNPREEKKTDDANDVNANDVNANDPIRKGTWRAPSDKS